MKLRCVGRYHNTSRALSFDVGQEFDATPEIAGFLASDAPLCFVVVTDEAPKVDPDAIEVDPDAIEVDPDAIEVDTAMVAPTVDRMVRRGRRKDGNEADE